MICTLCTHRVSSGTGQSNLLGKGTEVHSLSWDNRTSSKSCHWLRRVRTGRDGLGQPLKIRYGTREGIVTIFLSKSGPDYFFPMISCFRTSFPLLEPFCYIVSIWSPYECAETKCIVWEKALEALLQRSGNFKSNFSWNSIAPKATKICPSL